MQASQASAEAAIQAGRQHYAAKRYKPALEQFTLAMKACPCARGMKRARCSCKNYEEVASKDGSIFKEAMYNCKCSVGKTFNKCDNDLHTRALDYRAGTFEALEELERARRDAEWMLELAPRRLDGYLRLGKIARLLKKNELAWKIYSAGIEVGKEGEEKGSMKMQQLLAARQPLQRRFACIDPLQLPLELILLIFGHVDFATLVRSLRVSKTWRHGLANRAAAPLWKALIFTNPYWAKHAPTAASLKKLVSYSGNDVRQIVISDAFRFRLSKPVFAVLMYGSSNLERLELHSPHEAVAVRGYQCRKLKHLLLDGFDRQSFQPHGIRSAPFPGSILESSSASLEYLEVVRPPIMINLSVPHMQCLRSLRLEQQGQQTTKLPIFDLATKLPALERLWLHDIAVNHDIPIQFSWSTNLKHLHTLVVSLRRPNDEETALALVLLLRLNLGKSLRHIDLSIPSLDITREMHGNDAFSSSNESNEVPLSLDGQDHRIDYASLESFRLDEMPMAPESIRRMTADAVRDGKLHTFDICFPLEEFPGGSVLGASSISHLAEYDWLRGASSIRSIGISNFRFRAYPGSEKDLPLPSFLSSFPNLETLEIRSAHYEELEFCTVLKAVFKVTTLKTIFQNQVYGAYLDELKALAASHGVDLVWGTRPREWPSDWTAALRS